MTLAKPFDNNWFYVFQRLLQVIFKLSLNYYINMSDESVVYISHSVIL